MKTTEENNRLIAEFMGLTESSIPNKYWTEKNSEGITSGEMVEPKYHSSWDWLMPVVNKIRTLYNNCEVDGDEAFDIIDVLSEGCTEANIFQAFDAVVQFIEWYNEQK